MSFLLSEFCYASHVRKYQCYLGFPVEFIGGRDVPPYKTTACATQLQAT